MVGEHHVVSFGFWDGGDVFLPFVGVGVSNFIEWDQCPLLTMLLGRDVMHRLDKKT